MLQEEMKGPIIVLGCHKSGTGLVRSLIDGAPEVFFILFETHFSDRLATGTFVAE
jgi:hypothetical protein